ncbi:MAG: N(4)-(beta-N-acetylglucosaminyl)-L-asparaginase [Gemmataceae bacterium]
MPQSAVIATWPFGEIAVQSSLPLLAQGQPALDAALVGAQAVEDDPTVNSVGYGGLPNSAGTVSLDSCVMEGRTLNCGAVAVLENVKHAAAVAKRVMERTPHILLVGNGAKEFALQQGFRSENLLTPEALAEWQRRLEFRRRRQIDQEQMADSAIDAPDMGEGPFGHDTVTVLARDQAGSLGGVCTTSGLANKLPGRVGDSPIIGAALYVDDTAGAAGATGVGEEVIRIGGSLLVVERMRAGRSPQQACEDIVRRLNDTAVRRGVHPARVAFIAMDPNGQTGAACTEGTGFRYAVGVGSKIEVRQAKEIGVEVENG